MSKPVYFSHDCEAKHDIKLLELRQKGGWEAYGIFWALVEDLCKMPNYEMEKSRLTLLAYTYNLDISKLEDTYNECIKLDLLTEKDGKFFSLSLKTRMELLDKRREKQSRGGKKGMANRYEKQEDTENEDKVDITNLKEDFNSHITEEYSKEEYSKEKEKETADKSTAPKNDFVKKLLDLFDKCYLEKRGLEFETATPGKERNGMGKLLTVYKKKNKTDSETTLKDMEKFFNQALDLPDKWHFEKMSPMHIASNLTEIKSFIKNRIVKNNEEKQKEEPKKKEIEIPFKWKQIQVGDKFIIEFEEFEKKSDELAVSKDRGECHILNPNFNEFFEKSIVEPIF